MEDFKEFFSLNKKGDPLIIHCDDEDKELSETLKIGARAIQNHIFFPTKATMPVAWKGHGQTFLQGIKHQVCSKREYKYDRRDVFKLSDGGQIHVDLKGKCFLESNDFPPIDEPPVHEPDRPLLFILPGLTSDTQAYYI